MSEWSPENRMRGRSVPSPQPRADRKVQTFYIERHTVSVALLGNGIPPNRVMVMLASSEVALDKLIIKKLTEKEASVTLIAESPSGDITSKVIALEEDDSLYKLEGWKSVNFAVEEGEELWVQADQTFNGHLTMEFIKRGRTVDSVEPVVQ
jgi:hypothetical protein